MTATILDIQASRYHADELMGAATSPTLSASIAKILCAQSPAHARFAHPRLNPDFRRDDDPKFDIGNVFHAVFLEGRDVVEPLAFPDWRTAASRELRDEVRSEGKIPLLVSQWQEVQAMVDAVRAQLPGLDVDPPMFTDGKPEVPVVWQEDGVWCRALIDWLRDDYSVVDDAKTTGRSANPDSWTKTMYGFSGDIQVVFNRRAVRAVTGITPEFRFLAVECEPPYLVSVVSLAPSALELAEKRADYAIALWKKCLATGEWPGYPTKVCYAEAPSYLEWAWLEKEAREGIAA